MTAIRGSRNLFSDACDRVGAKVAIYQLLDDVAISCELQANEIDSHSTKKENSLISLRVNKSVIPHWLTLSL